MADQETEQLRETVRQLTEALGEFRDTGTLSDRSLRNLNRAQRDLTDATEDQTEATEKAERALKDFYSGLKDFGSDLGDTLQAVRDNREQFSGLNPSINATSDVLQSAAGAVGNMSTAVGAVVGGLTALIPGVGLVASTFTGLAASKVTEALAGVSQEAIKAGEAFFRFGTAEMDRVVGAFRQIGAAGAVGSEGIDGLYEASLQAGLSVTQFAQLVGNNARGLAFATGSATESARAIAEITQAAKPFQDQLLALGMGLEQQSEVFSDYIVMSRRLGRQQTRDYASLAEGAAEYAFELDELSRLTGLSRDEAQKALEAQMSNTRFRATLAKAEATGGQDLVKALRGTAAGVEAFGGRKLAEGFQDAFGGLGTESARQFEIATGGLGRQIVENLRSGAITQDQALQQIQQAIQGRLQSLGGMDFIERVGNIGTVLDPMLLEMIEFSQRAGVTAEDMSKLREEQQKARESQTENTENVVKAQQSLQALAMQVDNIVKETVFPNAASAVKMFTETLTAGIEGLADLAGFEKIEAREDGGPIKPNQPYLVGEAGPELIVPGNSGTVLTAEETKRVLQNMTISGANNTITADELKQIMQNSNKITSTEAAKQFIDMMPTFPTISGSPATDYINNQTPEILSHIAKNKEFVENAISTLQSMSPGELIENPDTGASVSKIAEHQYQHSDAMGSTTYNTNAEWIKHQLTTLVPGLAKILYADGRKYMEYGFGGGKVGFEYDANNQLIKESAQYAMVSGTIASLVKNLAENTQTSRLMQTIGKEDGGVVNFSETIKQQLGDVGPTVEYMKEFAKKAAETAGYDPKEYFGEGFRDGGVVSGPSTGYTAMLHGTEAVVPLPDGEKIPVENQSATSDNKLADLMTSMNATLQQIARSTQSGADGTKQMIRVVSS